MQKLSTILILAALVVSRAASGLTLDRVDPPSWWVGMAEPTVQLMLYGDGIARADVSVSHPGVRVAGLHRTSSTDHLFVDLHVAPGTEAGTVVLRIEGPGAERIEHGFELAARAPGSADREGFDPSDVIYLLMPDRFANGDPSNDIVEGMADGLARDEPYGRHGGDIQGIIDHLDYIAEMGFTQLWLNPVLENDQPDASYHGYAITDFYRVDARLGSNELYRQLVEAAAERGIGVIQDIVLNHAGSGHDWMATPPASDWFNRQDQPFQATTHNREALFDPYAAEIDVRTMQNGWFVETMPDLNQHNRYLANYLVQNTVWWIEYAGLSGLRVDTWPYPDKDYLAEWTRRVLAEYPNLNITGEDWTTDVSIVAYWQAGSPRHDGYRSYVPSMLDFPLQDAIWVGLTEEPGWGRGLTRIYRTLGADYHYGDAYNLVTFPDNHDMSRIFTRLEEDEDLFRIAMTMVLTMRGIPQIFYGTEILMANPGTESHGVIRSDFPGGWGERSPNAFTGRGLDEAAREAQDFVRSLLSWRQTATAVHAGRFMHYQPQNDTYVYFRHGPRQTVMVAINLSDEPGTLELERFAESIGAAERAREVLSGVVRSLDETLELAPKSATIYELE